MLNFRQIAAIAIVVMISTPAFAQQKRSRWVKAEPKKAPKSYRTIVWKTETTGLRGALQGQTSSKKQIIDVIDKAPLVITEAEKKHYDGDLQSNLKGRSLSPIEESALAVAKKFYQGLSTQNIDLIRETLSDSTHFSDEAYPSLVGSDADAMWTMITQGDIQQITYKIHHVEGPTVYGSWVADYTLFGNKIHNEITSKITVRNGKIETHRDDYDFALWAKQAMPGLVYWPVRAFGVSATTGLARLAATFALYNFKKGQKKAAKRRTSSKSRRDSR